MSKKKTAITKKPRYVFVVLLSVILIFAAVMIAAAKLDNAMSVKVENAGRQLTFYSTDSSKAQYFVDGHWIAEKDMQTLLLIGIDEYGSITDSESYNNGNQADFLALLIRDESTGESMLLHLNRDTMTDIPILGIGGRRAGTRNAQLALSYTYGSGREDSCKNTVDTVSNLLYGIEIDHYITVTMDAVAILNDWVGGVTVEVMDDFSGIDDTLIQGQQVTLMGEHALNYVRTRNGLADSTNLHRMERQRQYALQWLEAAAPKFENTADVADLLIELGGCYYTDCTASELAGQVELFAENLPEEIYVMEGESVRGTEFMEYYVDEIALQQLVAELMYAPVGS